MVAVRSAHINKAGEFDPEKWIASLGITSQKSCECLAETWAYCLQDAGASGCQSVIVAWC
mgnify:CR=1 FL=1